MDIYLTEITFSKVCNFLGFQSRLVNLGKIKNKLFYLDKS